MRGRDSETSLILQMLLRGRVGSGGVILVEGEAGMGKSLLLAEAAKAATAQGYATVVAAADEFERMIPLFPLLLALGDPGYAGEPGEGARTAAAEPDARMRGVARVRGSLERLAAAGPVLVTVDDLQYADPVTLLALRVLPRQLAALPVSWVLARSTDTESDAAQLFDLLDHEGADRLPRAPAGSRPAGTRTWSASWCADCARRTCCAPPRQARPRCPTGCPSASGGFSGTRWGACGRKPGS